ncbi:MAG: hypothetical protein FJ316_01995 [SAR202 cluster bacterium]|nr:hypothetical protein [SAR202 cluster bacterium]
MDSRRSNWKLAWRVGRYLAVLGFFGIFRLAWWAVVQGVLPLRGLLALLASPSSSGRAPNEFKDMYQPDSPQNLATRGSHSDAFWRMYLQAYTPRAWSMRRLFPMTTGRKLPPKEEPEED